MFFLWCAFWRLFFWHYVSEDMINAEGVSLTVSKWARTWNLEKVQAEIEAEKKKLGESGWMVVRYGYYYP